MDGLQNDIFKRLLDQQDEILGRLRAIELSLAEKKGERRMALWLVGITSTFAGGIASLLVKLWTK